MNQQITFYPPTLRRRVATTVLTFVALLFGSLSAGAQDVSIDLESGHLIASVTDANETGFSIGLRSLWRHEQLALSLTATDRDAISESGEISFPSAVLGSHNNKMIIIGGRRPSFMVVSLPKGYRITGYELVLVNDLVGANLGGKFSWLNTNNQQTGGDPTGPGTGTGTMRFYETKPWRDNETNSGNKQRTGSDNGGYNANQVRYIQLGSDWQNGQIGTTADEVLATATASDGDTDINNTTTDTGKEYVIKRTSTPENPMGNQIYFRLVKNYFFYGLSVKSFVIYFTAEGTFDIPIQPNGLDHARRVVMSPFKTNKIDIGKLERRTQEGTNNTYFAYDYHEVKDLTAYNYLYQEKAVLNGEPFEREKDDKENDIIAHITPVKVDGQNRYAFGNDTYFVEPPVSIHTSSGLDAPIGYRIVGAKFECLWADASGGETHRLPTACRIYYQSGNNNRKYHYLGDNSFTLDTPSLIEISNSNNIFLWKVDDEGNIFFENAEGKHYLACRGEGDTRILSLSNAATGVNARFNMRVDPEDDNKIYYLSDGGNKYYLQYNNNSVYVTRNPANGRYLTATVTQDHPVTYGAYNPGPYTLKVYDKDENGNFTQEIERKITDKNSAAAAEPIELKGLNNDAVKFSIEGLPSGQQALVQVTLQLQALDPYINSMQIKCIHVPSQLQLAQTFTASNFRVSGGEFKFYVPDELDGEKMDVQFADLYSNYGDNTYWGERLSLTNSRYCFVTSDYFLGKIDGNGNGGLYDESYNPNADYKKKVITSTAGNVRFKFNNAENLGTSGTGQGYLEEYPFSVKTYLSNYLDPDESGETAKFSGCKVKVGSGNQVAESFFVFIADETRYNIAPTYAWQHRQYAFYRMDVKAIAQEYEPVITWKKIYDKSLYADDNTVQSDTPTDLEDSQWGVELGTTDEGQGVTGYLTINQINKTINDAIAAEKKAVEEGHPTGTVPTSRRQILYIDASDLLAVYNTANGEAEQVDPEDLENLKKGLGANALVFLPPNTTSKIDNFAYKVGNSFRASNNIVLTDKQPFFSPFTINVDEANHATYTREITVPKNGQVTNATVMLPFTIDLSSGKHTNPDNKCAFTINTMNDESDLDVKKNSNDGSAFFSPITANRTEANKPYMVNVTKVDPSLESANGTISFVVTQKGSDIIATPIDETGLGMRELQGESVTGDFGGSYKFTNWASYSGYKYDRAKGQDIFYFANNKYLNLHTLSGSMRYLYSYPFRGIYRYTAASTAKQMRWFDIVYGENPFFDTPTAIDMEKAQADLMVKAGQGYVTLTTTRSQDVVIYAANGISMKRVNLTAGESQTVALPAGPYILNGVKIVVK